MTLLVVRGGVEALCVLILQGVWQLFWTVCVCVCMYLLLYLSDKKCIPKQIQKWMNLQFVILNPRLAYLKIFYDKAYISNSIPSTVSMIALGF